LERISFIVGTLLIGITAFLVVSERQARNQQRRGNPQPVEKLAEDLKQAWAGYHTP
jgi:hypothetical protein